MKFLFLFLKIILKTFFFLFFLYFIISLFFGILVFFIFYFSSIKSLVFYNYQTSFECGFSSSFYSRYSFSIHYILISLIFLLLDLEFIISFWLLYSSSFTFNFFFIISFFFFIILLGLLYEWFEGKLDWIY